MSKRKLAGKTIPFVVEHAGHVRECAVSAEALADLVGRQQSELTIEDGREILDDHAGLLESAGQSVWRDGDVKDGVALVTATYLQRHRDRLKRR